MRTAEWIAFGFICGFLAVAMSDTLPPEEPDRPWDRPRPPLDGDEWMQEREPEQGSQPDHAEPPSPRPFLPPSQQFKRLSAGKAEGEALRCPKCHGSDLEIACDLSFFCRTDDEWFSAPMNIEQASAVYAGFFDVRRAD